MNKKHFLIIGGSRGIGKSVVSNLAIAGNKISVVSKKLYTQVKNVNINYFLGDITDKNKLPEIINEILNKQGKINHLVFFQRFRGKDNDWEGEFETSLTATKNIIELLKDNFDESKEKSIVIISSVVGSFIAFEQPLSYHIGKAGLNQLIRYYAVQLGVKNIRVNGISPAVVIKEESKMFYLTNNKFADILKKIIPLGRLGTPEDIMGIVNFLCSDASRYVTGQNIIVDGGLTLLAHEGLIRKQSDIKEYK
jgi:NAD(P)-dependent dehydrogenase (short-subunit alcohol dehydrogenase family)